MRFWISVLFISLTLLSVQASALPLQQDLSTSQLREQLSNSDSKTEKAEIYEQLISRFMRTDADSMYYFANEYVEYAESEEDDTLLLKAYYNLGRYYAVKGISDEAISALEKAYELKDVSASPKYTGQIVGMMGYVYYFDTQYELAIQYYREAISYFEQAGDKRSRAIAISTIGSIYYQQRDFESAKKNYKAALKIKEELRDSVLMSTDITNLGLIYQREQKLDSALIYAEKALRIDMKQGNTKGISDIYGDMSSIYRELKDYDKALEYATKSLEYAYQVNTLPLIRDAYEVQYKVYEESGKFEEALESYIQFKTYSDSVINIETREKLVESGKKYETEKKEQTISLLKSEKEAANLWAAIIILAVCSMFIVVGIIYRQSQKIKEQEKQLRLESIQREMENYGILIAEKDSFITEVIEKLRKMSSQLKTLESRKEMNSLVDSLRQSVNLTGEEEQLLQRIEQVNSGFFRGLEEKFSNLSKRDKRLASLVQMELSNKEIGNILAINSRSVVQAKYRLKKKLDLDTDQDLHGFLKSLSY